VNGHFIDAEDRASGKYLPKPGSSKRESFVENLKN
jgi:hypothetical protein